MYSQSIFTKYFSLISVAERNCTCPGPIEGSGVMPTAPLEPPGGPICVKSG